SAETVIPALAEMMSDRKAPDTAQRAKITLLGLPKLLAANMALMTNRDAEVRLQGVARLDWTETTLGPAVSALIQCLQDTNEEVAVRAAWTLSVAELEPATVVAALTKC